MSFINAPVYTSVEEFLEVYPQHDWLREAVVEDVRLQSNESVLHWLSGTWFSGTWKCGVWHDGIWHNGIWYNGFWHNGYWYNGIWYGGIWDNGIWHDGSWHGGTWIDGAWYRGSWNYGNWYGGAQYQAISVEHFDRFVPHSKYRIEIIPSPVGPHRIQVGCKTKTPQEWREWLDGTNEYETPRNTEEFRRIRAHILSTIVYLEELT